MGYLLERIRKRWSTSPSPKTQRYINQFFDCKQSKEKVSGRVEGNHGIYTVTIELRDKALRAACSCYIGSRGRCHHCEALALTYIHNESQFVFYEMQSLDKAENFEDVRAYLQEQTLASMLDQMRQKGISQKSFAETIGMSTRKLSAIKSSELRNRHFNELGAVKLACLWIQERFG